MRFDRYLRHGELTDALRALADAHPDLVRLQSIGGSFEGREILLAVVTRFETGADRDKPALWVDWNIHATEVAGSMACLYFLKYLVDGYGRDPDATRVLRIAGGGGLFWLLAQGFAIGRPLESIEQVSEAPKVGQA